LYRAVSNNPQVRALNGGVDILVATPGRLLDLMQQGFVELGKVEILVLDEADRMLDMGFIPDLRRIVARVPVHRQTLLFSATMPDDIRRLAAAWLRDPVNVQVAAASAPAELVRQSVHYVEQRQKPQRLAHFLKHTAAGRTLVFTRTKRGADRVARHLQKSGIRAEAIHGNKSQSARERALERFKSSQPPVLVATDIAARGLDIDEISHVVNFDMPEVPETYVHRIGRTGRAGAAGIAVSFCDRSERPQLRSIEQLTRQAIAVEGDPPVQMEGGQTGQTSQEPGGAPRPAGRRRGNGRPSRGKKTADARHHSSAAQGPTAPAGAGGARRGRGRRLRRAL
jgi:ATP-dependent RNA helicase RhlE